MIRRHGPISQSDLATMLNLQRSTILRIIKDLESEGLVKEVGKSASSSKGGRRASLLELKEDGAFAIGVDFEADSIVASLVDVLGRHVGFIRNPISVPGTKEQVLQSLADTIEKLLHAFPEHRERIIGIGVAMPGQVDSESGLSIYAANFKDWRNVNIANYLYGKFQIPVKIEHSLSLMALGELWYGEGSPNMICLGFRHGIGLGIVTNGIIYRGGHRFAGEIGHINVVENGEQCRCGGHGCLETVASEWAMLDMLNKEYSDSEKKRFKTMEDLYAAFRSGDPALEKFADRGAHYIAKVLSDIIRVLDPDKIILSGNILSAYPKLKEKIEQYLQEMKPQYAEEGAVVSLSKFDPFSISIGAATLILSGLFTPGSA
jgi:predicted NBD/HSP70 family sugar kinase